MGKDLPFLELSKTSLAHTVSQFGEWYLEGAELVSPAKSLTQDQMRPQYSVDSPSTSGGFCMNHRKREKTQRFCKKNSFLRSLFSLSPLLSIYFRQTSTARSVRNQGHDFLEAICLDDLFNRVAHSLNARKPCALSTP